MVLLSFVILCCLSDFCFIMFFLFYFNEIHSIPNMFPTKLLLYEKNMTNVNLFVVHLLIEWSSVLFFSFDKTFERWINTELCAALTSGRKCQLVIGISLGCQPINDLSHRIYIYYAITLPFIIFNVAIQWLHRDSPLLTISLLFILITLLP